MTNSADENGDRLSQVLGWIAQFTRGYVRTVTFVVVLILATVVAAAVLILAGYYPSATLTVATFTVGVLLAVFVVLASPILIPLTVPARLEPVRRSLALSGAFAFGAVFVSLLFWLLDAPQNPGAMATIGLATTVLVLGWALFGFRLNPRWAHALALIALLGVLLGVSFPRTLAGARAGIQVLDGVLGNCLSDPIECFFSGDEQQVSDDEGLVPESEPGADAEPPEDPSGGATVRVQPAPVGPPTEPNRRPRSDLEASRGPPEPRPEARTPGTSLETPPVTAADRAYASLEEELDRLHMTEPWRPREKWWFEEVQSKQVVVRFSLAGLDVAAGVVSRLRRLGSRVRYEFADDIPADKVADIYYPSVDLRAAQAIQAAIVDLGHFGLTSEGRIGPITVWVR